MGVGAVPGSASHARLGDRMQQRYRVRRSWLSCETAGERPRGPWGHSSRRDLAADRTRRQSLHPAAAIPLPDVAISFLAVQLLDCLAGAVARPVGAQDAA